MKRFLAIDLGASSGRHIVGWEEDGRIQIEEIHRFRDYLSKQEGHLIWDIDKIFAEVKSASRKPSPVIPISFRLALIPGAAIMCCFAAKKRFGLAFATAIPARKKHQRRSIESYLSRNSMG